MLSWRLGASLLCPAPRRPLTESAWWIALPSPPCPEQQGLTPFCQHTPRLYLSLHSVQVTPSPGHGGLADYTRGDEM